MSDQEHLQAIRLVKQAYQALRNNDRAQARILASQAAGLAPDFEDAWLILAALSSSIESLEFAEKALAVNPGSERALKAVAWAKKRWVEALPVAPVETMPDSQPINDAAIVAKLTLSEETTRVGGAKVVASKIQTRTKAQRKRGFPWLWMVGLVLLVGISLVGWLGWQLISADFEPNFSAQPIEVLIKPSLTPSETPTLTSTLTLTASSTATATASSTATSTSTATNTFTPTSLPTNTSTKTRTATVKPSQTRIAATKTSAPIVPPQGVKVPAGINAGEHWIDVDISKQRAYAYEGSTLVRAFVVSTGISSYPTVTGTYRIYVKYRYAPMSGVGWTLPNVPYVMYFYKGYGLHGTYWHSNFGTPMSHGCINFKIDEAGWVYNFTVIGSVVNLHY